MKVEGTKKTRRYIANFFFREVAKEKRKKVAKEKKIALGRLREKEGKSSPPPHLFFPFEVR